MASSCRPFYAYVVFVLCELEELPKNAIVMPIASLEENENMIAKMKTQENQSP